MPYYLGIFSNATPPEWREFTGKPHERHRRALEIAADTDAEVVGMWWEDAKEEGYVLLAGGSPETLERLGCHETRTLLTAAEKAKR